MALRKTLPLGGDGRIGLAPLTALLLALAATGAAKATWLKDALDFGDGRDELVHNFAVSPDGKFLAVYRGDAISRAVVTLWDLPARKLVSTVKVDGWWVTGDFAYSPDGKSLMVYAYKPKGQGAYDDALVFWDLATLKESRRIDVEGGPSVFSPDGKTMVAATADPSVVVYDLQSGKKVKTLSCENVRKGRASALAVSPDGKTLAAGVPEAILLFDLEKGDLLHKIEAPKELSDRCKSMFQTGLTYSLPQLSEVSRLMEDWPHRVDMLAFSPDGKRLVSAENAGHIVLVWDPATGKNVDTLRVDDVMQLAALAFSPDGTTLALVNHDGVHLWDFAQFGFRNDFFAANWWAGDVKRIAFTPDGGTLITASERKIKFWDVPAGPPKRVRYPKAEPYVPLDPRARP